VLHALEEAALPVLDENGARVPDRPPGAGSKAGVPGMGRLTAHEVGATAPARGLNPAALGPGQAPTGGLAAVGWACEPIVGLCRARVEPACSAVVFVAATVARWLLLVAAKLMALLRCRRVEAGLHRAATECSPRVLAALLVLIVLASLAWMLDFQLFGAAPAVHGAQAGGGAGDGKGST
jgi:hypothetical protein